MNSQAEQSGIGFGWIIFLAILHIIFNPIPALV